MIKKCHDGFVLIILFYLFMVPMVAGIASAEPLSVRTVADAAAAPGGTPSQQDNTNGGTIGLVSSLANAADTITNASAEAYSWGQLGFGYFRGTATADVSADSGYLAESMSYVQAFSSDEILINPSNPALNGTLGTVVFSVSVSGSMNATKTGYSSLPAQATWGFSACTMTSTRCGDLDGAYVAGSGPWGDAVGTHVRSFDVLLGTQTTFLLQYGVSAETRYRFGSSGEGHVEALFENTILWQGISQVLDAGGNPISFTLTSNSGIDWTQPARRSWKVGDFDGDGSTDVAAFHLPSDQFFTHEAGELGGYGWGGVDCYPLVWDHDGDGVTDVSIYHIPTNQWFVRRYPGDNLGQFGFGGDQSIPVPGDYNGDGVMERAFYHWPTNRWFIEGVADPIQFGWGGSECIPLAGDYDGDGSTDMMLYHVPTNQWFVYGIGNLGQFGWGGADCLPVPGDWNGDGKIEFAVYHVSDNEWVWRDGSGIAHFMGKYGWGGNESFPIPGDYDGDGTTERGFYRYVQNRWFIDGEPDFVWGWGGQDFMPITSQMAVYNWFRFMLGRFQ